MSTFSGTYDLDMSILANYQALMGDIHDQILTFGWVASGDTGVTDPGGVGSLPAQNDYSNFQIYQPDDGLTDLFLKVGYGRNGSNNPSFELTIGSGSNGSGTITGNASAAKILDCRAVTAARKLRMAGDATWLGWMLNLETGNPNETFMVAIDRSRDGAGVATSDFATMFWFGSVSAMGQHTITFSGTNGSEQTGWRAATPFNASGSSGIWVYGGNEILAFPVPLPPSGLAQPAMVAALGGSADWLTPDTTTTVDIFGATHTYLHGGYATTSAGGASAVLFLRWE